jgi:hypothetical protein
VFVNQGWAVYVRLFSLCISMTKGRQKKARKIGGGVMEVINQLIFKLKLHMLDFAVLTMIWLFWKPRKKRKRKKRERK